MAYKSEIEQLQRRYDEKPEQWFAALADAYRKKGQVETALEIVRRGIDDRPNYVSGHIVLGRCLVDVGEDAEALTVFQQVLELDGENIIALRMLGEIAERHHDPTDARRWLERLLEVDPMNQQARDTLERLAAQGAPATDSPEEADGAGEAPETAAETGAAEDEALPDESPLESPAAEVAPMVAESADEAFAAVGEAAASNEPATSGEEPAAGAVSPDAGPEVGEAATGDGSDGLSEVGDAGAPATGGVAEVPPIRASTAYLAASHDDVPPVPLDAVTAPQGESGGEAVEEPLGESSGSGGWETEVPEIRATREEPVPEETGSDSGAEPAGAPEPATAEPWMSGIGAEAEPEATPAGDVAEDAWTGVDPAEPMVDPSPELASPSEDAFVVKQESSPFSTEDDHVGAGSFDAILPNDDDPAYGVREIDFSSGPWASSSSSAPESEAPSEENQGVALPPADEDTQPIPAVTVPEPGPTDVDREPTDDEPITGFPTLEDELPTVTGEVEVEAVDRDGDEAGPVVVETSGGAPGPLECESHLSGEASSESGESLVVAGGDARAEVAGATEGESGGAAPEPEDVADVVGEGPGVGETGEEPLLTETMAEVYARQGLMNEARGVYEALLAARPGDARLRGRLAELEEPSPAETDVVTARAFLLGILHRVPGPVIETGSDGGQGPTDAGVAAVPVEPTPLETAFGAGTEEEPAGDPARPAANDVSLASLFGSPPASLDQSETGSAGESVEDDAGSLDELFPTEGSASDASGDLSDSPDTGTEEDDDFRNWLQSLKS